MAYKFTTAPLPKPVFDVLNSIARDQNMTQRAVVVAGVLAIVRLRELDEANALDVLAEAKSLCPRRDAVHAP